MDSLNSKFRSATSVGTIDPRMTDEGTIRWIYRPSYLLFCFSFLKCKIGFVSEDRFSSQFLCEAYWLGCSIWITLEFLDVFFLAIGHVLFLID